MPKERRPFVSTQKEKAVEVTPRLCFKMVIQEGFEPPTHGLEGLRIKTPKTPYLCRVPAILTENQLANILAYFAAFPNLFK